MRLDRMMIINPRYDNLLQIYRLLTSVNGDEGANTNGICFTCNCLVKVFITKRINDDDSRLVINYTISRKLFYRFSNKVLT